MGYSFDPDSPAKQTKAKELLAGCAYVPYSSLESVIEQSKENCHLALRQTQGTLRTETPDWQPWLDFFLRALQQQKRRLALKMEREKNALGVLSELGVKILDYAQGHGRVTTRDMVRETGVSPNTLKATFTMVSAADPLGMGCRDPKTLSQSLVTSNHRRSSRTAPAQLRGRQ